MRVIDADALEKEIKEKDIMGGLNYRWYIQNAPTVDVLEQIRAEIDGIEINGQVDDHTMFVRSGEQVKQMALDIINKYMK